jgi:hypothetical protein
MSEFAIDLCKTLGPLGDLCLYRTLSPGYTFDIIGLRFRIESAEYYRSLSVKSNEPRSENPTNQ